jgi:hypothetical protein
MAAKSMLSKNTGDKMTERTMPPEPQYQPVIDIAPRNLTAADLHSLKMSLEEYRLYAKLLVAYAQSTTEALARAEERVKELERRPITCQIYGHEIGLVYCENCNVPKERYEKS